MKCLVRFLSFLCFLLTGNFCAAMEIPSAQIETKRLYLSDTYLSETTSKVMGSAVDEKGKPYVLLDQTVFYPQGGGQPADWGSLSDESGILSEVIDVRTGKSGEIRHYLSAPEKVSVGMPVKCQVNMDRRLFNARYHTAGHLLSNVVEELFPSLKATKCHAFPKESYLEFPATEPIDPNLLQKRLDEVIAEGRDTKVFEISAEDFEKQFYKLPYEIPGKELFRVMQIGDYYPIPCGGTHLRNISEIGKMLLGKMTTRKGVTKVSYSLP